MSIPPLRVLLANDEPTDRRSISRLLSDAEAGWAPNQFELIDAKRLENSRAGLAHEHRDVVLLYVPAAGASPAELVKETLKQIEAAGGDAPLIVLCRSTDPALALEAIRAGAEDCLFEEEVDGRALIRSLRHALARQARKRAQRQTAGAEMVAAVSTQGADAGQPDVELASPSADTELTSDETDAERQRMEEKANEIAGRLSAIVNTAVDGILTIDERGKLESVNPATEKIFGYTAEELIGRNVSVLMPPTDRTQHDDYLADYLRTGKGKIIGVGREVAGRRKDGTIVPLELTVSETFFNGRRIFTGILRDITAHKQAEDALRQSEARFRSTFENAAVGIAHIGIDGAWLRVNQRLCEIVGYRREEVLRRTIQEITHPDDLASDREQVQALLRGEIDSYQREKRYFHKDGHAVWVNLTATLQRTQAGGPLYFIAALEDISERKQAEARLKQTVEELARSNAELAQFAYVASHDLQEPLRSVAGCLQLLERQYGGQLGEDADELIEHAVNGALRMRQLINDLLAFSRLGTYNRSLEPTDCQLIMEQVLENLRTAIEEANAVVTHDDFLPTLLADDAQLVQLFQNLINNAIKFRSDRPPRIHVGAERQTSQWRFYVQDNGIGIDPQHAERIFVIFQRLHAQHMYPGTGIGLAICKKIVEGQGGRIWVCSQPGSGSIFYFTIPDHTQMERAP